MTLTAWACIKGQDRQFNSFFLSDGFDPGTVHWRVRNDGVLGLAAFELNPGEIQILASLPVLLVDTLGMWHALRSN